MNILIAGPGCPRCIETEKRVRNVCASLQIPASIEHYYDVQGFAKLGIMMTPAVVINDKVVIQGKIPSEAELKKIISAYNK